MTLADLFPHSTEAVDDMRAHISNRCLGRKTESKTTGGHIRGSDIPLRYKQHETPLHHRNIA